MSSGKYTEIQKSIFHIMCQLPGRDWWFLWYFPTHTKVPTRIQGYHIQDTVFFSSVIPLCGLVVDSRRLSMVNFCLISS